MCWKALFLNSQKKSILHSNPNPRPINSFKLKVCSNSFFLFSPPTLTKILTMPMTPIKNRRIRHWAGHNYVYLVFPVVTCTYSYGLRPICI